MTSTLKSARSELGKFEVKLRSYTNKLQECQKDLEFYKKRLAHCERKKEVAKTVAPKKKRQPTECAKKSEADCKRSEQCSWISTKLGQQYCRKKRT